MDFHWIEKLSFIILINYFIYLTYIEEILGICCFKAKEIRSDEVKVNHQ